MSAALEATMHGVSQWFLTPVLVCISLLFAYAWFAVGGFAWQCLQRRRGDPAGFELHLARSASPELTGARLEALAARRLEAARLASRVTPMLGLVATMIPMGPALQALGEGDLAQVSRGLSVAFSAVILALIAASLTHWIVQVRRRWYLADLAEIASETRP